MIIEAGTPESLALCLTAVMVGVVHTLLGPDHYVPFVAMSRAGGWPLGKTMRVTAACGLAHVAGSAAIGLAGLALGLAVMRLEHLEALRGDAAAWLMIGFGLAYLTWGLVRAARAEGGAHDHVHVHADGTIHAHRHTHDAAHLHVHAASATSAPIWSPWLLFLVFAFGPCEPLIPLLMYPAAKASWWTVAGVAAAFAVATIVTMSAAVVVLRSGLSWLPGRPLQRYGHAFAGAAILACGALITLGL
jgi:sulfite exporter TauE/SafE